MVFSNKGLALKTLLMASGLYFMALLSGCSDGTMEGATPEETAALLERIKPAVTLEEIRGESAQVKDAAADDPATEAATSVADSSSTADMPGKKLYGGACMACHSTGAAGAPKLGDKSAWEPRAETGMEAMLSTSINGKGAMPPNGGSAYTEAEMQQVIEYMLAEAGLSL
jgi:cytochrome c5